MPESPLLHPDARAALGHQITLTVLVPQDLYEAWTTACLNAGHDPEALLGSIVEYTMLEGMQDVQRALVEECAPFGDDAEDDDDV